MVDLRIDLPDDFFKGETIGGYYVSPEMKKVWAVELDLLDKFVDVCKEYNLKYYISGGTLLGAVRHKGYIPWDNDIDIMMPRQDFNKLLEIGGEVFKEPFFFQTPITEESRFFSTFIKIRNNHTTGASKEDFGKGINCGIFIDVFCLEELPNNKHVRAWYYKVLNEISKMKRFCFEGVEDKRLSKKIKHGFQKAIFKYVLHSPDAAKLFRIYQKYAGRYSGKKKKEVGLLDFGYHPFLIWDKTLFNNSIALDFANMKLDAPEEFDAVLRKQYGDYWKIPDDKSTHDYYDFNADIPYSTYFKNR